MCNVFWKHCTYNPKCLYYQQIANDIHTKILESSERDFESLMTINALDLYFQQAPISFGSNYVNVESK